MGINEKIENNNNIEFNSRRKRIEELTKKVLGDPNSSDKFERKGNLGVMRDLYFEQAKLPKFSPESITVIPLETIQVEPFVIASNPNNTTRKHRNTKNGPSSSSTLTIQDRAKVIYEILVGGLKEKDGKIHKYPASKKPYSAVEKDIEQICFEYEYKKVKLSVIVVNKYGNAIYITRKQLNLNTNNPRKIAISEFQDPVLSRRVYGKKDQDIFLEKKEIIKLRLQRKIEELVNLGNNTPIPPKK